MKIRDMKMLLRVAESGSMTLAARQLHVTPATVSAAVGRMEDEIGVRVFERTTRSLHTTDEGELILESCRDMVMRWQRTLDDVRGDATEVVGRVHLTAPADTSYQMLERWLPELCDVHPGLDVVVHTGDVVHHIHRDAIDMAIRYGPLRDSALTVRRLARSFGVLVASPGYLAAAGTPEAPEELAAHRHLTLKLAGSPVVTWQLQSHERAHTLALNDALCGDGYLARRWALAGRGIAFKSLFDVIDDLEAGRLVRVLPTFDLGPSDIHAVFPSRRFLPARVRALDEALTARFAARAARCDAWVEREGVGSPSAR